jgi:CheY-like chemotaxis protein
MNYQRRIIIGLRLLAIVVMIAAVTLTWKLMSVLSWQVDCLIAGAAAVAFAYRFEREAPDAISHHWRSRYVKTMTTSRTGRRQVLRVLLVEDNEDDAELLLAALEAGGYSVLSERVETADALRAALSRNVWDVVLSDYSLPRFDALSALAIVRERDSHLPFIILSGTIGEDSAVRALEKGADDFLVKGNYARLVPAIERACRTSR